MWLLAKYSLCAIKSTLSTPMSSLGCFLSAIPMLADGLTSSGRREIWTCTRSEPRSRDEPECVRSLSYDPVNAWPRIW